MAFHMNQGVGNLRVDFEGLHRIDDKDDSDELLDKTQYGRLIYVAGLAPSFSVNSITSGQGMERQMMTV
jgi:hypothetical protein